MWADDALSADRIQQARRRWCATRPWRVAALGVFGGVLALAPAAAARPSGEPPAQVFGAASRPRVSITVEPPETSGGACYLSLVVLAGNGVETQAATSDQGPPATCRKTPDGHEVVGTSRIEGREIRYRATVTVDWRVLEWTQPAAVALRDGRFFQLAGRYERLTEPMRLASAKAAFDAVDRDLNLVYRRLVASRDPVALTALRADQRRWLAFRDFTLFDGDNAESVGPGTSSHVREQSRRTLARIRFLTALLDPPGSDPGDTLYSDGRSGNVAVRRVGEALAFSARIQFPSLNVVDAPPSVPCSVSGLALPEGANAWLAEPRAMTASDPSWTPDALRLAFDPQGRLRVEAAGRSPGMLARVIQGTYAPQRRLVPAEAPLRSLLWQLPERAFNDTTEGLSDSERRSLVLTGAGGDFAVRAETADRLVLRHHDGLVTLLRFAGADGSAVLAVELSNGRNLSLQVWRQASAAGPFLEWEDAVPVLPVRAFFAADPGAEPGTRLPGGRQVVYIDGTGSLRMSLLEDGRAVSSDYEFVLEWDGFGFVAVQSSPRLERTWETMARR
jgi:uncharacterized protein YecT (DUF1311 family)